MEPVLQPPSLHTICIPSQFGTVLLTWEKTASGPKVRKITLPGNARAPGEENSAAAPARNSQIASLAGNIRAALSGKAVTFSTDLLDLGRCPVFQQRVLMAEHAIPRGYVSTYGRIARHLGVPGGARAVGNALAKNPFPIVIPCHRALRSDGSTGGFQGGPDMKRQLLAWEGVRFTAAGKVLMERVWY
jgi:methylated-DNA-[protein]-cysteine S-methyltransferase